MIRAGEVEGDPAFARGWCGWGGRAGLGLADVVPQHLTEHESDDEDQTVGDGGHHLGGILLIRRSWCNRFLMCPTE